MVNTSFIKYSTSKVLDDSCVNDLDGLCSYQTVTPAILSSTAFIQAVFCSGKKESPRHNHQQQQLLCSMLNVCWHLELLQAAASPQMSTRVSSSLHRHICLMTAVLISAFKLLHIAILSSAAVIDAVVCSSIKDSQNTADMILELLQASAKPQIASNRNLSSAQ